MRNHRDLISLFHSKPEDESLRRGETRLTPPGQRRTRRRASATQRAWDEFLARIFAGLIFAGPILVFFWWVEHGPPTFERTKNAQGSTTVAREAVGQAKSDQRQFAAISFDSSGVLEANSSRPEARFSVVFTSGDFQIHTVDVLPSSIRKNAILIGRSSKSATRIGLRSKSKNPPVFVFNGDVNIDQGPLQDEDQMLAMLQLRDSRIERLSVVRTDTIRGPPSNSTYKKILKPLHWGAFGLDSKHADAAMPIQIYIVGKVVSYRTPDSGDSSHFHGEVIDLSLDPLIQRKPDRIERRIDFRTSSETFIQPTVTPSHLRTIRVH